MLCQEIQSPDQHHETLSSDSAIHEYPQLHFVKASPQLLAINKLVKISFPVRRSFLPICSFVTRDGFLDIPLPTIVDYIVSVQTPIEGRLCSCFLTVEFPHYSQSLLEPLTKPFTRLRLRSNQLFFRGNLRNGNGVYSLLQRRSQLFPYLDIRVMRPRGELEVNGDTLQSIFSDEFSSYYLTEKTPFDVQNMFSSVLSCRCALFV